jgi:toxin FitB
MYLLDTNVLSEVRKSRPHPNVIQWLSETPITRLFLSVAVIAELTYGIARAPQPQQPTLENWLLLVKHDYTARILPGDLETLELFGRLTGEADNRGRRVEAMDALIAASAIRYDLTLVTRNISDFVHLPVKLFNPWLEEGVNPAGLERV